jgi:hypothetical protein
MGRALGDENNHVESVFVYGIIESDGSRHTLDSHTKKRRAAFGVLLEAIY